MERWKWNTMFQDLPPVKGHNVQMETAPQPAVIPLKLVTEEITRHPTNQRPTECTPHAARGTPHALGTGTEARSGAILSPVSNRWLRFVIALVALVALGAAGYRIFQHEQQLADDTRALDHGADAADVAIETVGEIKARAARLRRARSGRMPFWTARAGVLLDKLRGSLLDLDRAASTVGAAAHRDARPFRSPGRG